MVHSVEQIKDLIKLNNSTVAFVKTFAENIVEGNVHFLLEKNVFNELI